MRRLAVATVLGAMVSVVPGSALLATAPAQAATTASNASTVSRGARAEDNATVCAAAKRTVQNGTKTIVADLRQAAAQMRSGDKSAADATVKAVGPKFASVGTSLQQVAGTASDPNLKSALVGLGGEFEKAGKSLTDVNSLRSFDQAGIQSRGRQVGKICSPAASPGTSGSPRR